MSLIDEVFPPIHCDRYRWAVKITAGLQKGGNPVVYHKKDLRFQTFIKWKWYFDYRAALIKVQNPRWTVDTEVIKYDYIPEKTILLTALKNKIKGQKAQITKWKSMVRGYEIEYNKKLQLYPLTEDPAYVKAMAKINKAITELENAEALLKKEEI